MQEEPKYKNIDLVEQFYKENVDLKAIQKARASKKPVTSGLEPYTGEFGKAQKKHLLNRTMMGYAHRHYKDIENLTLDQALDLIFTPETKPDPPVNDYYHEVSKEEIEAQGHVYVEPGTSYVETSEPKVPPIQRYQSFYSWLLNLQVNQSTKIHWKLVFFLHNLLPASQGTVKMLYPHYMMLFNYSFRPYHKTIKALTLDPLMLFYLNLQISQKQSPDENYARELQELFTIGKGPNAQYTEYDIIAASRVLTGWQYSGNSLINEGPIQTIFNSAKHDPGTKNFSSFYGNRTIDGKMGNDGALELDELIEMIFETQECALYLSRRLYQFFVNPIINETAEVNIIKPLSEILRNNNFQLDIPLRVLLKSEHFFDSSFYFSLIKAPTEFMFGFMKEFEFEFKNYESKGDIPAKYINQDTTNFYKYKAIDWYMNNIGLRYIYPPSVSGWPAYYQAPVYDLFWINSITISERTKIGEQFGKWGLTLGPGDSGGWVQLVIDRAKYVTSLDDPTNLESVIEQVSERLLASPMSEETRNRIKNAILDGQSESHFTELVQAYLDDPSEENKNVLSGRLEDLFAGIFKLGEFQLF
ncbi:DUF1800 family protein [Robertkochia marina]|uniref:DUF1800 family protein n=1 Tax=Robertkochia marina TaxID=1227945 RepID=A0A4S3M145_9FLAO|nr:DUF1800 family protein [Robertkochia marina]THD67733.1 DUF1800 family protein [Robertkochia marina]TRZ40948.1 DUF1800 family protein [Robertkochia marina]